MKTCKAAIATIIRLSIMLRLKILLSVLLTVLKLRFSLVRKYFWFRVIVESWPESLKMDSSNADVCSGEVPCFEGKLVRSSFSTWIGTVSLLGMGMATRYATHSDLKVHKLLGESAHLVVKAESIFSNIVGREDEVALAFLLTIHNYSFIGSDDLIVNIERASCLDLVCTQRVR